MPTVLRIGPYRFYFFANENEEPAHIHVQAAERKAKYWLTPVRLAKNVGFRSDELGTIERLVTENRELFLRTWDAFFTR